MTFRCCCCSLLFLLLITATAASTHNIRLPHPYLRRWRQRLLAQQRRRFRKHSDALAPMLSFRRPTAQAISQRLSRIPIQSKFNHPTAGMTHPYFQNGWTSKTTPVSTTTNNNNNNNNQKDEWWPALLASPKHWRILRYRQTVGHGWDCYCKVRDAALQWDFQTPHQGICTIPQPQAEIYSPLPAQSVHQISHGQGRRLMTYSRAPFLRFLFTINPVQVVYDVVDQMEYPVMYTSTAYATCDRHFLQGEERVTVVLRDGVVQVELVSCSRPHAWKGWCVWPFLARTQDQFFRQQIECLRRCSVS